MVFFEGGEALQVLPLHEGLAAIGAIGWEAVSYLSADRHPFVFGVEGLLATFPGGRRAAGLEPAVHVGGLLLHGGAKGARRRKVAVFLRGVILLWLGPSGDSPSLKGVCSSRAAAARACSGVS